MLETDHKSLDEGAIKPELRFQGPASYKTVIGRFKKCFADVPVGKLTVQHAEDFVNALFNDGSKPSIATHRWYAASLNYYYRNNLNIFLSLKIPYRPLPIPIHHGIDEVRKVLKKLPSRYYAIYIFIYGLGMKIHEVLGLKMQDIDMTNRIVKLSGKRQIKLPNSLLELLPDIIKIRKEQYKEDLANDEAYVCMKFGHYTDDFDYQPLFASRKRKTYSNGKKGRPAVTATTIHKYLREANDLAADHVNITTMSLRHSFAIEILNDGNNILEAMIVLGHKDIRYTLNYTRVTNTSVATSPLDIIYEKSSNQEVLKGIEVLESKYSGENFEAALRGYLNDNKLAGLYKTGSEEKYNFWLKKARHQKQNFCLVNASNMKAVDFIFIDARNLQHGVIEKLKLAISKARKGVMMLW